MESLTLFVIGANPLLMGLQKFSKKTLLNVISTQRQCPATNRGSSTCRRLWIQRESWNISYISALGAELVLNGRAEIAWFRLTPLVFILDKKLREKNPSFAMYVALARGERSQQQSIHFFAQRVTCDCLEKEFNLKEAKKEARKSECMNCKKEETKKKLLLCSRCNAAQYCSKDCQVSRTGANTSPIATNRARKPKLRRRKKIKLSRNIRCTSSRMVRLLHVNPLLGVQMEEGVDKFTPKRLAARKYHLIG